MRWRTLGRNVLVFLWGALALPFFLALWHWVGATPEIMFAALAICSGLIALGLFGRR